MACAIAGITVNPFNALFYLPLAKPNHSMSDIRIPDWQSRGRGFESHLLHGRLFHILLKSPLKNTNFSPTYADDLHFRVGTIDAMWRG